VSLVPSLSTHLEQYGDFSWRFHCQPQIAD
jgi:hypothetical protein